MSIQFLGRLMKPALTGLLALGLSTAALADHLEITRAFSGIWDQPDHQSQGFILQISEAEEGEKVAVVYWFTYGGDLLSSWYIGVGPVEGHEIPLTLYEGEGIGFLDGALEGDPNVVEVGTLLMSFRNCNQGTAAWESEDEDLGSGEVRIKRLTSIYNMRCSGGISDDTPGDAKPKQLEVRLESARDDITGDGKAKLWERSDRSDFKVSVEDMPNGAYSLQVCEVSIPDSEFEVSEGEGSIEYRSPDMGDKRLLNFNPKECRIDVLDGTGVALTSGDRVLAPKPKGPGDKPDDDTEIEVDLSNTGVLEGAKGEAEYEFDDDSSSFKVKIKNVPAGDYAVHVANSERGVITVTEDEGEIRFSDPQKDGQLPLSFPVLGQLVEVYAGEELILEVLFPDP